MGRDDAGDRPRRLALLPPLLARWRRQPGPVRGAAYDTSEHVLRAYTEQAREQDKQLASMLGHDELVQALADVPEGWLEPVPGADEPAAVRERYVTFLRARLDQGRGWLPA